MPPNCRPAYAISSAVFAPSKAGPLAGVPVANEDRVARFVVVAGYIRRSDNTVRQEVFLPYKHVKLSVVQHRDLSEAELWEVGDYVAKQLGKPLLGRADVSARDARAQRLNVLPEEPPRNHADIIGWAPEKAAQLSKAQVLAADAGQFIPKPVA